MQVWTQQKWKEVLSLQKNQIIPVNTSGKKVLQMFKEHNSSRHCIATFNQSNDGRPHGEKFVAVIVQKIIENFIQIESRKVFVFTSIDEADEANRKFSNICESEDALMIFFEKHWGCLR